MAQTIQIKNDRAYVRWPNDPGYPLIAQHTGTTGPPNNTDVALDVAGRWKTFTPEVNHYHGLDSDFGTVAPMSSPDILVSRYPTGQEGGLGNGQFYAWSTGGAISTFAEMRSLYLSFWFNIRGANPYDGTFENLPIVMKAFGFVAVAGPKGGSDNQCYWSFNTSPDVFATEGSLTFIDQRPPPLQRNYGLGGIGNSIQVGNWYQLEMQATLGTVDTADGTLKFWLRPNGGLASLVHSSSDVKWRNAVDIKGFYAWNFNPTYGGDSVEDKSRNDYILFDDFRICGELL